MNFSESDVRSFSCNGRLIKAIRETLGLTQQDFAKRAGYSVRLVGKAEAGKPVSRGTIEVLAEALSTDSKKWRPDDLIFNPSFVVKDCLQAKYQQDEALLLQLQSQIFPNIQSIIQLSFAMPSFAPSYTGVNGMIQYHRNFHAAFTLQDAAESGRWNLFHGQNEFVVWDDRVWLQNLTNRQVHIASRFTFENNLLVRMEDRIQEVVPLIRQDSNQVGSDGHRL